METACPDQSNQLHPQREGLSSESSQVDQLPSPESTRELETRYAFATASLRMCKFQDHFSPLSAVQVLSKPFDLIFMEACLLML